MPGLADAVGIGFAIVGEEHLLSCFLSSPGTTRNMYVADGRDVEGIRTDLNIALGLGIGFSLVMAVALRSKLTALVGTGFGLMLYLIYRKRAGL